MAVISGGPAGSGVGGPPSCGPRAKNFKGDSVEVDAIAPRVLKQLVRDCIEQHIDHDTLKRTRAIEAAERDTLQTILDNLEADT